MKIDTIKQLNFKMPISNKEIKNSNRANSNTLIIYPSNKKDIQDYKTIKVYSNISFGDNLNDKVKFSTEAIQKLSKMIDKNTGETYAHRLAFYYPEVFSEVVKYSYADKIYELLKIPDNEGYTVAHYFALNPECFVSTTKDIFIPHSCKYGKFDLLNLTANNGFTVAQTLAVQNPRLYYEETSELDESEQYKLLTKADKYGNTVMGALLNFKETNPDSEKNLLDDEIDNLLKMTGFNKEVIALKLLKTPNINLSNEQKMKLLLFKFHYNGKSYESIPVACSLARNTPELYVEITRSLTPEQKFTVLDLNSLYWPSPAELLLCPEYPELHIEATEGLEPEKKFKLLTKPLFPIFDSKITIAGKVVRDYPNLFPNMIYDFPSKLRCKILASIGYVGDDNVSVAQILLKNDEKAYNEAIKGLSLFQKLSLVSADK